MYVCPLETLKIIKIKFKSNEIQKLPATHEENRTKLALVLYFNKMQISQNQETTSNAVEQRKMTWIV